MKISLRRKKELALSIHRTLESDKLADELSEDELILITYNLVYATLSTLEAGTNNLTMFDIRNVLREAKE